MRHYTKNSCYCLMLLSLIALSSCNEIKDPQPDDQETIPEQVVDLLESKFPDAEQTTIKVVEKDRLWEATYLQNSQQYYVGLDSNKVLATYKIISPNVPDSVATAVARLAIRGGTLSDFRQNMDASIYWAVYEAKYVLRGTEYLLRWGPQVSQTLAMNNYSKFVYPISAMDKLPANARAFFRSENLSVTRGSGFVNSDNKQNYEIYATDAGAFLFSFNASGALIFTEYNLQKVFLTETDLPAQILKSIQNDPLFQGFEFVTGMYNKSYKVTLKKGNETFTVTLDDNANVIATTYAGL